MKILCVCDQIDPLVYSNSAKERYGDVDIILCAGDLPMEYVDFIVSTLNKPTFFIFGNHNLKEFAYYHKKETPAHETNIEHILHEEFAHAHGAVYIGFKIVKSGNILIAGASGSLLYNNGLNQYTDKQMFFMLLKMLPQLIYNKIRYGRFLDIFLTHTPPLGIQDKNDPCHRGFKCYKWFLHTFKPRYMIHGHIHLYDMQEKRITQFEHTVVINAYSHYLLDFIE